MKLTWMGRYRELVRAMIYYSNCSNRSTAISMEPVEGDIALTKHEYQVLEYIIEFEDEDKILADISRDVGILPGNLSPIAKHLVEMKLIERYRIKGNHKNVVLKPTVLGKKIYNLYCNKDIKKMFKPFFKSLDSISDEELVQFEKAVNSLGKHWENYGNSLIKEDTADTNIKKQKK